LGREVKVLVWRGEKKAPSALFESPNTCGGPLQLLMVEAIEGMMMNH